ncbi:MAG: hypothetical protein ACETWE_13660 [Candidatus Bathyarchaeia archaeon]
MVSEVLRRRLRNPYLRPRLTVVDELVLAVVLAGIVFRMIFIIRDIVQKQSKS